MIVPPQKGGVKRKEGILLGILGIAGFWDIKARRVPNSLCIVGALLSLILCVIQEGLAGGWTWLTGALPPFLFFLFLYLLRAVGAGDVKLAAVTGSFLGFHAARFLCLGTLVAGAVLSLLHLFRVYCLDHTRVHLREDPHRFRQKESVRGRHKEVIPFSVCFLVTALLWILREGRI